MKKILLLVCSILISLNQVSAADFETAKEAVKNMGVGWNLGNTLEANKGSGLLPTQDGYWYNQGLGSETWWGQPKATEALLLMMKNAGFGAIRVPVTWYNHMDKDGKVDPKWMKRVHEVVNYVLNAGMYCIVNVHHDTGADDDKFHSWLKASDATYTRNKVRYEGLWTQIANEFRDCDEHLLFEGYNEMLDDYNSWCFASYNTTGRYNAEVSRQGYEAINNYAQSFVNAVRATGGNNAQRNLVVNTYAAACGTGNWNTHLQDPLKYMKKPKGETNHLIFEVHNYPSIANLDNAKRELDQDIKDLQTYLTSQDAPVIYGEWGTSSTNNDGTNDYRDNHENLLKFLTYFVQQTKAAGMASFYWMGISDAIYRSIPAFSQPDLAECIVKAYHGDTSGYTFPIFESGQDLVAFEGEKQLNWGDGIKINGEIIAKYGKDVQISLDYEVTSTVNPDIQLYDGDWKTKPSFIINGKTYAADYNPTLQGATVGKKTHTDITFPEADYKNLAQLGLIIHGSNVKLTKVVCHAITAGISSSTVSLPQDGKYYNLQGQQIARPSKGIYICNGKKYVMR